ncbi:MAG: hypothetical protein QM536_01905 [Chitinophagaceae bacterium]|nr:hypothetical protein [Chitinophagaceae bacterium]
MLKIKEPHYFINILIQLAKIDGIISQEEIDMIMRLGKLNNLSDEEINLLFDRIDDTKNVVNLSDDEKFNMLYNLVQMMKVDGILFPEEMEFCAKISQNMGYTKQALYFLITNINSKSSHKQADMEALKKEMYAHIKK